MTGTDEMVDALNALKDVQVRYRHVLGAASEHLHLAIVHMERTTAESLLYARLRQPPIMENQ